MPAKQPTLDGERVWNASELEYARATGFDPEVVEKYGVRHCEAARHVERDPAHLDGKMEGAIRWVHDEMVEGEGMDLSPEEIDGYAYLVMEFEAELPAETLSKFKAPTEDEQWPSWMSPGTVTDTDGETLYRGLLTEEAAGNAHGTLDGVGYVDKRGNVYGDEFIMHIEGDRYIPVDTDADVLHRESFHEYANTMVVVLPFGRGKARIEFLDGVLFTGYEHSYHDLPADVREAADAVVKGTGWVSTDAWRGYMKTPNSLPGFARAKSGWHSTMEQSSQAETVRAITDGDHPIAAPIIVVFGRTSNVMSTGLDLYIPEAFTEDMDALFDGTSGAPGYAGVR